MTATVDRLLAAAFGRPVAVTTRGIVLAQWRTARWALAGVVVLGAAAVAVWAAVGEPSASVVGFARQGVIWFSFSLAIAVAAGYPGVHVAMGQTRRALVRASVLAALAMSVVFAVVVVGVIQAERVVYAVAGWQHVIIDDLTYVANTSQVGLLLGEYVVVAAAGQLCGLLCGAVYYRGGAWWGTLTLPLTVGPVILVQAGMSADLAVLGSDLAVGTLDGALARGAVALVVLAAVSAAYGLIVRTTPIRTAPLI